MDGSLIRTGGAPTCISPCLSIPPWIRSCAPKNPPSRFRSPNYFKPSMSSDAILLVSFGGPDGPADVIPFLENVLRGRHVPRERMLEVAGHYHRFGGKSPINDQNRALLAALREVLREQGPALPVYWGNRNWHPLLADTMRQ